MFTPNSGITSANQYPVLFHAVGTSENPITFTSATSGESPSPGDWDGLEVYDRTLAGSKIENCQVLYGGGRYSNIYVYGLTSDKLQIKNSTIANSSKYGIRLESATPLMENITYANNALGDTN